MKIFRKDTERPQNASLRGRNPVSFYRMQVRSGGLLVGLWNGQRGIGGTFGQGEYAGVYENVILKRKVVGYDI